MALTDDERLYGAGPWTFDVPALEPGEKSDYRFRTMTYHGRPGYFTPHLPIDDVQITNESPENSVRVRINDQYSARVLPNSIEPFDDAMAVSVTVINEGDSAISAGEVTLEVATSGYGADDAARERKGRSFLGNVLSDVVPGL